MRVSIEDNGETFRQPFADMNEPPVLGDYVMHDNKQWKVIKRLFIVSYTPRPVPFCLLTVEEDK